MPSTSRVADTNPSLKSSPSMPGRWKKRIDINDRVAARDPRPTVQLCERESNEVMMAANEVPEFLLHSEVSRFRMRGTHCR